MGDAAIDGISDPGLSFVSNGHNGFTPISHRDMQQQLRNVASSEYFVDGRESGRALLGAEVGCEHTVRGALAAEELARAAR